MSRGSEDVFAFPHPDAGTAVEWPKTPPAGEITNIPGTRLALSSLYGRTVQQDRREGRSGLPADDRRTAEDALDGLLELSRSEESRARQLACRNLCTCHVRADDDRVWTRLLELVEDPDPLVRRDVIHALTDSTPAPRVPAVIQALESRHNDPDERTRRRVRKTVAHYRRTGKVSDAAG